MSERVTKQGIRDLGGRSPAQRRHIHSFTISVVLKTVQRWDPDSGEHYTAPVHGHACICGETREERW